MYSDWSLALPKFINDIMCFVCWHSLVWTMLNGGMREGGKPVHESLYPTASLCCNTGYADRLPGTWGGSQVYGPLWVWCCIVLAHLCLATRAELMDLLLSVDYGEVSFWIWTAGHWIILDMDLNYDGYWTWIIVILELGWIVNVGLNVSMIYGSNSFQLLWDL